MLIDKVIWQDGIRDYQEITDPHFDLQPCLKAVQKLRRLQYFKSTFNLYFYSKESSHALFEGQ